MDNIKYFLKIISMCTVGILICLQTAAAESVDIQLQPVPVAGDISINYIGEGVLSNCYSHEVHIGLNHCGMSLVRYSLETASENYQIIPSNFTFSIFATALSNSTKNNIKNSQIMFKVKNDKYAIEERVKLLIDAKKVALERYEGINQNHIITRSCNLKPYETYLVSLSHGKFYNNVTIYKFDLDKDTFEPMLTIDLGTDWPAFPLDEVSTFNVYAGSQKTEAKFWDQSLRIVK